MPSRYKLLIPQTLYRALHEHALAEAPNECCGLLAGKPNSDVVCADRRFPLLNYAAAPTVEYLSEPRSMFDAVKLMRAAGLDIVAVYHSHPTSAPIPSRKDIASNFSDSVMNLIISLKDGQPEMKAWWLFDGGFEEAKWGFTEDDGIARK